MSGFIRPEAAAFLLRWREVLAGVALLAAGLWAALGPGGLLGVIGWGLAGLGAVLVAAGVQRGRFRAPRAPGPGSVDVDEGQVTYFGPLTGGAVALRDLAEIALLREGQTGHWRLTDEEGTALYIPLDADGVEALFDAFTVLPGFRAGPMLRALEDTGGGDVVLWQRRAGT